PVLARELSSIYYAPLILVHAAYSRSQVGHPLNGFGFLSGADQKHPLLGSIWDSSVFEGRAPADEALLTFFIGGAKHPGVLKWQERDFLALIRKVAAPVLKINGDPKKVWIKKYERAIPQYFLGHREKMETIEKEAAKIKGLHLTGNYFTGVSLGDTARHAEKIAWDTHEL
ncbi:MAG: protoporphyrinogen oxidase, partial [Deltaproteobacteria bacterium]|nr:protoporphyrinogen oxidase [Deltaproteobacteria bacterium]